MKDTFYYIAGRFSPIEMGFTYYDNDVSIIEVKALNYKDAEEEVKKFCYAYYGVQEEKDMWDGIYLSTFMYKQLYKVAFEKYKALANDPKRENYKYFKLKSMKLYETPKITISYYKNPDDYIVSETTEITEFFS